MTEEHSELSTRDKEKARYQDAYKSPKYRMGWKRITWAVEKLKSYGEGVGRLDVLDVGTGRGELVVAAYALGVRKAWGVDAVPELAFAGEARFKVVTADAWELPFGNGIWDVVFCLDVLEHILEEDVAQVLSELFRVSRHRVLVTASNRNSVYEGLGELHVTRLDYDVWDALIHAVAKKDSRDWSISRSGVVGVAEGWDCVAL